MDSKRSRNEQKADSAERHDPFAVDFFGGVSAEVDFPGFSLESAKASPLPEGVTRNWSDGLAQIEYGGDLKSRETPSFPVWIEHEVRARVLPSISSFSSKEESINSFETVSFGDVSLERSVRRLSETSDVIVRFESCGENGYFAVGTEFASDLIESVLGVTGQSYESLRRLSSIELAICEYLSASALSVLNKGISERQRLIIKDVSTGPFESDVTGRAVEIVADLVLDGVAGMITILLPAGMVQSLNGEFKNQFDGETEKKLIENLDRFIEETSLCLRVGKTTIPAVEIPFLEPADIVLIDNPVELWWAGNVDCGKLSCCMGSSSNLIFEGAFEQSEDGVVGFRIVDVVIEAPTRKFSRILRSESVKGVGIVKEIKEPAESRESAANKDVHTSSVEAERETDAALVALENVMVDLRVQVAGRKISLSELGKIRAGQIIDLGCTPEDPVELVAENSDRPIASGELVKIEEQLGVRITKVFV